MSNSQPEKLDFVLLADIGGTNVRFALMDHGAIGAIEHMKVADFSGASDAIATVLSRQAWPLPAAAVLGVAGPVENNPCVITNSRWIVDESHLQQMFGFRSVHLLNDFEAVAWSLPALQPFDRFPVGTQRTVVGAPMLTLGPGTGFGAACLFRHGAAPVAIVTEAGHSTLAATSWREERVIDQLRRRFGHVSVERTLSGPGLVNLYQAYFVRATPPGGGILFNAEQFFQPVSWRRADIELGPVWRRSAASGAPRGRHSSSTETRSRVIASRTSRALTRLRCDCIPNRYFSTMSNAAKRSSPLRRVL